VSIIREHSRRNYLQVKPSRAQVLGALLLAAIFLLYLVIRYEQLR
jgi:hypothetical protein